MSIHFEKFGGGRWILWSSVNSNTIELEYLMIDEDDIREHLRENPMPTDGSYTEDDLIYDLTMASGAYTLPSGTKEETAEYVVELVNSLV